MVKNIKKLFYSLLEKQHGMNIFLFNMVNKSLDEENRLSLIFGYNEKNNPTVFLIWDSQKGKLYGPYEATKDDVVVENSLIIEDYKWIENGLELYIYYTNKAVGCLSGIFDLHQEPQFELV